MVSKRVALGVLALSAVGGLVFIGSAFWMASRGIKNAETRIAQENFVPFRTIALDRPLPSSFEPVSSPAEFRDAAQFQGRFYLCGAPGLFAYDANGTLAARLRPGIELPPAPLVAMAPAIVSGGSAPQLWIATNGEGLLAFDGRRAVQIRPDDSAFRNLTSVLPLASGRVLVGTENNGVLVWDGQALAHYHPSLNELKITALAGTEPDLWIGTMDRGVYRWHAGQLDHFGEAEGLPDSRVLSLAVENTKAYAGTAVGVAEFNDGRFSRVLAEGFFAKSLLAKRDFLVIGTLDEGLLEISTTPQKPRLRNLADQRDLPNVEKLIALEGKIYALAHGGLFAQSEKSSEFRKVLETPGALLADGNVSALSADHNGRLWVGYFDRGLDVLAPGFEHAIHVENEHVFCINRIVQASDGALTAVATANGLVLFDGSARLTQVLGTHEGLIANQVTDVLLGGDSRSRNITVATPAGITTIDATGTSSLYAFHGLVNNHVYALARSGGRLLAGTLGGLSILDSGTVTASYTTSNSGLKHNWITAIAPVGNDWFVGTYGAGVLELDSTGRWSTFADWKAPAEINPNAMLVTDRAVYAGTLGKGLAMFNRSTGRWIFHTSGLPSLNVTALAVRDGYLYVGTDNGLVRTVEKELAGK